MMWINQARLFFNRLIISIYFRLILLTYGIILSCIFPYFSIILYIIIFSIYLIYIYIFFFHPRHLNVVFKTLIDFVFITLCLFGKPFDNIAIYTMLFIPVLNASNNSWHKQTSFLYIWGLLFTYLLINYLNTKNLDFELIKYTFISCIPLCLLHFLTIQTWQNSNNKAEFQDIIDDFFNHGNKSSNVFEKIKELINEKREICSNLYCFISHDDFETLHLVSSSHFVYSYHINLNKNQITKLLDDKTIFGVHFQTDNNKYSYSCAIPAIKKNFKENNENTSYLFLICLNQEIYLNFFLRKNLELTLKRLAQFLYTERIIRKKRLQYYEQIKEKGRFVDNAINTMHFIKNRLTSIQTLTDVINDIDSQNVDKDYIVVAQDAAKRSNIDIKSILDKSKYLLDKNSNPFHYLNKENVDIRKFFIILRQVWENSFPKVQIQINNIDLLINDVYKIDINIEGVEILFSDIIGNMYKYQKNKSICRCDFSENGFKINFINDYNDESQVINLVDSYNKNDKEEILKRKTYGVSNIKSFVNDMNINLFASLSDNMFCLTLVFKIIKS